MSMCKLGTFSVYLFWWLSTDSIKCEGLKSKALTFGVVDSCSGDSVHLNDSISDKDYLNFAQAINGGVAFGPFLNFAIDGVFNSLGWGQGTGHDKDLAGS
jgi:hypothetical protein